MAARPWVRCFCRRNAKRMRRVNSGPEISLQDNHLPEQDTTSRQHKTHNTQVREVVYAWHPWCGQKGLICEPVSRHEPVFRCRVQHGKDARLLEIPQWMFDRASCCLMHLAQSPVVGVAHLRQLHELLHATAASPLLEDQHRPFKKKGDADAQSGCSRRTNHLDSLL